MELVEKRLSDEELNMIWYSSWQEILRFRDMSRLRVSPIPQMVSIEMSVFEMYANALDELRAKRTKITELEARIAALELVNDPTWVALKCEFGCGDCGKTMQCGEAAHHISDDVSPFVCVKCWEKR